MVGTRKGARKSVPVPHTSVRLVEEHSVHTKFGTVLSSPLRSPADHSSTSTPQIQKHSSPIMPITNSNIDDENSIPTPLIQRHSSPMPITNSNVADENSSANYQSPASSADHNNDLAIIHNSQHSGPTKFSANFTECAQKLRIEMEEEPDEEEVESAPEPGFVYVHEHTVKVENAPMVQSIFKKYGDITKGSDDKSPAILSLLLEHVCLICNNLQETNFFDVSCIELDKRLTEVKDLERHKLNVGWLRQKIEYIIQAKKDLGRYPDVKQGKIEHDACAERINGEISLLQKRLCVEKAKCDEAEKLALDIKARVTHLKNHSLLHGLF